MTTNLCCSNVEEGLRKLAPSHDWTWLQCRRRELSEKAKENAKQASDRNAKRKKTKKFSQVDMSAPRATEQTEVALCSASLREVVPPEWHSAVGGVLGCPTGDAGSLLFLADISPAELSHRLSTTQKQLPSDTSPLDVLCERWIGAAQRLWAMRAWMSLCTISSHDSTAVPAMSDLAAAAVTHEESDGTEVLKALAALNIHSFSSLAVWRHAPQALLEESAYLRSLGLEKIADLTEVRMQCTS